ncbi:glycerol acyltransferase [Psychrobacter sp. Choline-02u-13]|jgi:1-acyl-sn-glycerol-3-phosphate acyltransferase|nr:lysophospholipid acyltransferase family protein [Psychrobacter sp. Urea-trap-18]MBA6284783.1 lysophospholipid acyltransferase family protein [Psychrobacter sp. Urea-trap-16]MBA6318598.1 lysophospholipid acyltransferase family protein [Psychrobacter sp. Urea-trap-20]MBA6333088.1 lysophospholipid acyltransferase family protein [Psychrobacter sp. Urea-trap-19]PKG59926.1 glycerol acyltransferase [Psychrobacter sp. Choline-3u-12]PKG62075.1 glycerol acyltransferase [Psychrobacter sp. Choline-02u-
MVLCQYLSLYCAVMIPKIFNRSKSVVSKPARSKVLPKLSKKHLGDKVPKRGNKFAPVIASALLKASGWRTVGEIPNISQAVVLALPHTSNVDGIYAIPSLFALDIKISIMGKHTLFKVPVFAQLLNWIGVIPIDRGNKGSVLQASIDKFKTGEPLFLGLSPEGTRQYNESWKTGFYYLAVGAGVPILPVAMDYNTKEIRFMSLVYPTGDIESDLPKIYSQYKGVLPRHLERLSQPLQDINNAAE